MGSYTWQYGDWRTYTDLTARRNRLALHLEELEAARNATSGSTAGMSASYEGLESRIASLQRVFDELEERLSKKTAGRALMRLNRRN